MIQGSGAELFELSSGQGLAKGKVQGSLMELLSQMYDSLAIISNPHVTHKVRKKLNF